MLMSPPMYVDVDARCGIEGRRGEARRGGGINKINKRIKSRERVRRNEEKNLAEQKNKEISCGVAGNRKGAAPGLKGEAGGEKG